MASRSGCFTAHGLRVCTMHSPKQMPITRSWHTGRIGSLLPIWCSPFLFIGPYLDPVRNKWVVTFGLIACAGVIPLALIADHIRGIPLP
jgi:hypothetical protein